MTIQSPAFKEGEFIPKKYACEGENISPPLEIADVPEGTESLAIMMEDLDAENPSRRFVHWVVWNIPASAQIIEENFLPQEATIGPNDGQRDYYEGPCPDSGTHHYVFRLFALDSTLSISEESAPQEIRDAMSGHILDGATLTGLYKKSGS